MKKKIGSALVVGGGISGIRSALDLATMGYRVFLIDRAPSLGGTLRQLDAQFPTDHCGMCRMLPMIERDASSQFCLRKGLFHENIEIMLSTELVALEGEPGSFTAVIRQGSTFVDQQRCMGCGECARVCPVDVPDGFNAGLTRRKAIYLPVPHNIPNHYVIDESACTLCGECRKVCPTGAVDLKLDARRSFRILVVDDELVVRDSTKEWLQDEGFSVDMAESGFEAVRKLTEHRYDLMLLDVKMPGMDGVEVLKRAKEMHPELPVIMMTAYATVETAVEAMKVGAMDYLMKPFDPEAMVAMVVREYEKTEPSRESRLEVGTVILSAGFASFDPARHADTYGYDAFADVVTSIEFERLISGSGPNGGRLLRPSDARPIRRIAWIQCVGSRNLHTDADYCSSVCCMFSIKEAVLAKERSDGAVETTIFYMDMRTFGKDFQLYRDKAEKERGVRFVRSRIHSVEIDPSENTLLLSYADVAGGMRCEAFDLVVLATGQKPPAGASELAGAAGIELGSWGFCKVDGFSLSRTSRDGVLVSGSFSGPRDISESVIQASAASLRASLVLQSRGSGLAEVNEPEASIRDVSRELPRVAVAVCTCGGSLEERADLTGVLDRLKRSRQADRGFRVERLCTREGWSELEESLKESRANRILIGACQPCVYNRQLNDLGKALHLSPALMDVVDIVTPTLSGQSVTRTSLDVLAVLAMGAVRLRGLGPVEPAHRGILQKALVVGGGIAGMTAALAIADHGFEVSLLERNAELGGNLRLLDRTIEGGRPRVLLDETVSRVEKHPRIRIHKNARAIHSEGEVGGFLTTIEEDDGTGLTLEHGVTILATGGLEAPTSSYAYGQSEAIVTQHELEARFQFGNIGPTDLRSVVMIQCVDSRDETRPYCSRICCNSALKNALYLKEQNPEVDVYVLYRDIMAYGLLESQYTKARKAGVIFVQYDPADKPVVTLDNGMLSVRVNDPILGRSLLMRPDLVVLATGIIPDNSREPARIFGLETDGNGFLRETEYKWRPVESTKSGVFVCGIAHSPRTIEESIAMAEAAAQRALCVIDSDRVRVDNVIAEVRQSLCSLCERCIDACPYGARWKDEEEDRIMVSDLTCQGCGSCAAVCPNSASVLRGWNDRQMLGVIDAALDL